MKEKHTRCKRESDFFILPEIFLTNFLEIHRIHSGPTQTNFFRFPLMIVSPGRLFVLFFFGGGLKISLATHMIITQKIFNQFSWNSYHIMVHNNFRTLKCILQLHKSVCPILFSVKSLIKNSKIWAFPNQYAHLFENLQNFYFLHLKRVQSLKVPKYQQRELLAKFMRSSPFSLLCPQIEFNIETKLRTP